MKNIILFMLHVVFYMNITMNRKSEYISTKFLLLSKKEFQESINHYDNKIQVLDSLLSFINDDKKITSQFNLLKTYRSQFLRPGPVVEEHILNVEKEYILNNLLKAKVDNVSDEQKYEELFFSYLFSTSSYFYSHLWFRQSSPDYLKVRS